MSDRVVIIGGGQCAAQAIDSLRRGGFDGAITLVGEEPLLPYQRPPLSKQYLAGELGLERVVMRPQTYYDERDVQLHLGQPVVRLDRALREVTLADGQRLGYDRLLLATGARPRPLSVPGRELTGIFDLRTVADVEGLRPQLTPGRRLAVVGGGFIGLEVAATARKLGLEVTVVEAAPRLMARVVSPWLSDWFLALHRQHGVDVRLDEKVHGFLGESTLRGIDCESGEVAADLAVVGIGVVPNEELAVQSGLACDDGILVDAGCRTLDESVFAAGDCARAHSPLYGRTLRLESVQNAMTQARVAAAGIMGQSASNDELPWFWTDQYDVKLQMAGLPQDYDQSVIRGDTAGTAFSLFHLKASRLVAVDVINNPREFMACRKLLPDQPRLDPVALADPAIPLQEVPAG